MNKREKLAIAYDVISGGLYHLPDKYCDWQIDGTRLNLNYYRHEFSFMIDVDLREAVARLRICLDYQSSLLKLHQPQGPFLNHHNFVLIQIIAQIYEGILLDIYQKELGATEVGRVILKDDVKKASLGYLARTLYTAKLIKDPYRQNILAINDMRDMIHTRRWTEYDKRMSEVGSFEEAKQEMLAFLDFAKVSNYSG